MDRLDVWLNAQRGWRRFALMWLGVYPFGWFLGDAWLSARNFDSGAVPGTGFLFWVAVMSVP